MILDAREASEEVFEVFHLLMQRMHSETAQAVEEGAT